MRRGNVSRSRERSRSRGRRVSRGKGTVDFLKKTVESQKVTSSTPSPDVVAQETEKALKKRIIELEEELDVKDEAIDQLQKSNKKHEADRQELLDQAVARSDLEGRLNSKVAKAEAELDRVKRDLQEICMYLL